MSNQCESKPIDYDKLYSGKDADEFEYIEQVPQHNEDVESIYDENDPFASREDELFRKKPSTTETPDWVTATSSFETDDILLPSKADLARVIGRATLWGRGVLTANAENKSSKGTRGRNKHFKTYKLEKDNVEDEADEWKKEEIKDLESFWNTDDDNSEEKKK
jgi:hypothetical protein